MSKYGNGPTWETPTKVGLWGPAVKQPPVVKGPRLRTRSPWGLGQVWAVAAVMVLTYIALVPFLVLMSIRDQRPGQITGDVIVKALDDMDVYVKTGPFLVAAMLLQWGAFVGVPWVASHRRGLRSLAKDFGLRFKKWDPLVGLGLAITLQGLMYGVGWVLSRTSLDLTGADNTNMVTDQQGLLLVFMVAAATVGAPFTEEILFRGLALRAMLRSFVQVDLADDPHFATKVAEKIQRKSLLPISERRRKVGVVAAAVCSSVLFGIAHTPVGASVAALIILPAQTGFLGLVFAFVAIKTKRLGPSIYAHIFFNTTSVTFSLLATR